MVRGFFDRARIDRMADELARYAPNPKGEPQVRGAAMNIPLLERELEQSLARRWREDGDEKALHELVTPYLRLVISTAGRFAHLCACPSVTWFRKGISA